MELIRNIFLEEMKNLDKEIEKIEPLGGMTNRNYLIFSKNNKYVFRKSGEGTSEIISRSNEINNCKKIKELGMMLIY